VLFRLKIFLLKAMRSCMFVFKNKKLRNKYYQLQERLFGKPNWIKEP